MPVRVKERKLFQDAKYLLYGPMMCRRSIAILKQLLAGIGWVLSCAFFVWRFKKKMSAVHALQYLQGTVYSRTVCF
jgi:hypothetical protein